jgi:glycosyltransferase involved in cell wall biosynthesis
MIVGLDAKRAFHNFSGLGNYSRLLIQSLSELYNDNQYFLYTPKYKSHLLHKFANHSNCTIITPTGMASFLPSSIWRSFLVAKDINTQNIDVFHGLSGELPASVLKMPKVVTMHDVIFLRSPEFYSTFDRKMYEKKFRHACKIADRIITVSKQTADDCIKYLGADAKRIEIIYQSCDPIFLKNQKENSTPQKYDLPGKFILNVGTMEKRKNLLNLVKALEFIDDEISLVAIGKRTPYTVLIKDYIKEKHLSHRVKLLHSVPFLDLPAIYAAASAFVYPSVFEGFGIPVLEALAVGTPVATSNISSMPEVGGNAALYFNPYEVEDMASRINLLLNDNKTVAQLEANRMKQLEKFSVRNISEKVNAVYHDI